MLSLVSSNKRVFLTLAILLFMGSAGVAQNCHFDIDKKDAFTNKAIKSSTYKIGPKKINSKKNYDVGWTMTLEKNDDQYFVAFKIILMGKYSDIFTSGQTVTLKLDNEKIVELTADADVIPVYMTAMTVYTHYNLRFKVDEKIIKRLSHGYITDMKFNLGAQEILGEIPEKGANRIMDLATCILQ